MPDVDPIASKQAHQRAGGESNQTYGRFFTIREPLLEASCPLESLHLCDREDDPISEGEEEPSRAGITALGADEKYHD